MKIALTTLVVAVSALACAPAAVADDSAPDLRIGQAGTLVNGDVVQTWTISGFKTSTDVIPANVIGTLWEATATNAAVEGTVIPIIPNFNARAGSDNYRVLFGVASSQGINPSTLPAGEKSSGKIYFDIPSGVSPDRVVFNDGQVDKLVWVNAPEPVGDPGARSATPAQPIRPAAPATPAQSPAVSSPAAPAAAGTPATSQGTPAATSQGTPAGTPAASAGTPTAPTTAAPATNAPAASQGTPAASQGTPAAPAAASPAPSPSAPAAPSSPAVPTTVIPSATPGASSAGTPAG